MTDEEFARALIIKYKIDIPLQPKKIKWAVSRIERVRKVARLHPEFKNDLASLIVVSRVCSSGRWVEFIRIAHAEGLNEQPQPQKQTAKPACDTCRFSELFENRALFCMRYPPIPAFTRYGTIDNLLTTVTPKSWCGEYQPKEASK